MSTSGAWCDNIIIQAVSNAFNCIIHITESDINKPDGTVITPVFCQERPKTIFIGYINELHYVSSVPDKKGKNKSFTLGYLIILNIGCHVLYFELFKKLHKHLLSS